MAVIEMIFYTLIVLGVLVTFHEFGHFWVARRCGIRVLRFSIGFGPGLLRWRDRQGTEFVIAALPLGGYVKMVDEREGEVAEADLPHAFNRKPVAQRMATVAAGPLANFLLAVVAYWIVFMLGVQGIAPIVDGVKPGSVADLAGLEPGQEIIAVDGKAVATWQDLGESLVNRIGEDGTIRFTVRYPDSNLEYDSEAPLGGWDVDAKEPDPIGGIGITLFRPRVLPIADQITPGSAAEQAGMKSGDRVLAVDGTEIEHWSQWVDYVRARPGQNMSVLIERDDQTLALAMTPKPVASESNETIGQVGMSVQVPEWPEDLYRHSQYGPATAFTKAWSQTGQTTLMILGSVKKMIFGDISLDHLSGPITIAKVAGASASYGLVAFLQFMALLSVSLGVLNLLPIPVLDGGHLAYYFAELIKGSPVSMKTQELGYRLGLFLIVGLMVLALYNDIARL
ncbi:MAG TPA: zinc metallopeptidase RseP [Porticoccaceae bacterium]|nr:zinc metallopeptidase RseP [Porticoccaceae bacterium]HCO59745.1 zinc metallopeptidase RseP [Porticoccaceae bacterium]